LIRGPLEDEVILLKITLKETEWEHVEWIKVTEKRTEWLHVLKEVLNFRNM
jgi:hypothetical protein